MTGAHIFLRAIEPEDLEFLYSSENDPGVWHLGNHPEPISRFTLEQYIINTDKDIFSARQLRLMISDNETKNPIGTIDLFDFDPVHLRAGVGILIENNSRRKGYAAEALNLLIEYCRNTLNLHQLYCNIEEDNDASICLFKNAGFEISALKKDWLRIFAQWKNELLLQLIL